MQSKQVPTSRPVSQVRALIVDDENADQEMGSRVCKAGGVAPDKTVRCSTHDEAFKWLRDQPEGAQIWLIDAYMPASSGTAADKDDAGLRFVQRALNDPDIAQPDLIVHWSKHDRLAAALGAGIEYFGPYEVHGCRKPETRAEEEACAQKIRIVIDSYAGIGIPIACDDSDRQIYHRMLPLIARNPAPVLVTGPTGSGKEVAAKTLARMLLRTGVASRVLPTLNCGAMPDKLAIGELIGAVKGSYSDSVRHHLGVVMEASGYQLRDELDQKNHGFLAQIQDSLERPSPVVEGGQTFYMPKEGAPGVVILDELASLPREAQAALLRALDGHPVKPVGFAGPGFRTNILVIGVTNLDDRDQELSQLLPDLVHRLAGWPIIVPSLLKRPKTATALIRHWLAEQRSWTRGRGVAGRQAFPMSVSDDGIKVFLELAATLGGDARTLRWLVERAATFAREDRIAYVTHGTMLAEVREEDIRKAAKLALDSRIATSRNGGGGAKKAGLSAGDGGLSDTDARKLAQVFWDGDEDEYRKGLIAGLGEQLRKASPELYSDLTTAYKTRPLGKSYKARLANILNRLDQDAGLTVRNVLGLMRDQCSPKMTIGLCVLLGALGPGEPTTTLDPGSVLRGALAKLKSRVIKNRKSRSKA